MPLRLFLLLAFISLVCSEHLQCRLCTPGEYCFQDERYLCPQHSTSVHGADNITHCVCHDGYHADASHACIACSEGFFCSNDMQSACPENRTSVSLSSSLSDCVCDLGYEGESCTACLPGFYKDWIGNNVCSPCPVNTFSSSAGSVACEGCGQNEEAASGSSECLCKTGYERVDGACIVKCEQYSTRNAETKICQCDPGHFKHNGTCAHTCDPGTFKADYGDESCSLCAEGHYQTQSAATTCLACMDHATSGEGSDSIADCQCLPEYQFSSGACLTCAQGFYKDWIGNEACFQCNAGTYRDSTQDALFCRNCSVGSYQSLTGQSSCLTCQDNSVSEERQARCLCNAGYSWSEISVNTYQCSACLKGSYKMTTDNTQCTSCMNIMITESIASTNYSDCTVCQGYITTEADGKHCNSCPTDSQYSLGGTSVSTCRCLAGYAGSYDSVSDTLTCTACVNGKYKPSVNNNLCTPCPAGNIGIPLGYYEVRDEISSSCVPCPTNEYKSSLTQCTACPDNSMSPAGSDDSSACVCAPGFTFDGSNCIACADGYVKALVGDHACSVCAAGKYTVAETCVDCPIFSTSPEASSTIGSCQCQAGFTGENGGTCLPCSSGTYKVSLGPSACIACDPGTYQDAIAPYTTDACVACPENTTSPSASSSISACQCQAGFLMSEDPSVLTCHPCAEAYYCPDKTTQIACSTGATSPLASDHAHDCTCTPGFVGSANNCTRCPVNFYCEGGEHVQQCHDSSSTLTLAGTTNVSACVCDPGFYEEKCGDVFEAKLSYLPPTMSYFDRWGVGNAAARIDFEPTPSWYWGDFTFIAKIDLTSTSNDAIYYTMWDPVAGFQIWFGRQGNNKNKFFIYRGSVCELKWNTASAQFNILQVVVTWDNTAKVLSVRGQDMVKDGSPGTSIISTTVIDAEVSCPGFADSIIEINSAAAQNNGGYENRINAHPSKKLNAKVYGMIFVDSIVSQSAADAVMSEFDTSTHFESALTNSDYIPSSQYTRTSAWESFTENICIVSASSSGTCSACPVDSWCYHNAEIECPGNSSSLAQTSTVAKCFCDEYFAKDAAGQCHLCGSHLVCHASDMVTEGAVEQCVQYSSNIDQHQSCVCQDGYYCRDGSTNTSCSDLYYGVCSECPIGFHCKNNVKIACSVNETSAVASSGIAECVCKPGYHRSGTLCLLCEKDSFCFDEVKYQCGLYDPELITLQTGSHAREQCLCREGFFRTDPTDLCKICPIDYYCVSESISNFPNVEKCIPNAYTLTRGTVDRSGCICDAGFVLSDDAGTAECLPCESGQRCGGGQVLDGLCGAHNRVANADHSVCLCLPGYEQNADGFCEPCVAPYYKAVAGDFACTLCPDTAHYLNSTYCVDCNENEEQSADGLSCSCVSPLVQDDSGVCAPCPADTYYDAGTCMACTAHSTTPSVTGATTSAACVCNPGYIANEGLCVSCSSGTYEKNGACVSCGVSTVSPEASHSSTQCGCAADSCQSYLWNHTCFGECEPTLEACTECQLGFFKNFVSATGNTDTCSRCLLHTFANETGQIGCHACPENSVTTDLGADSVTDCVCDKGNAAIQSSSVQCPPTTVCRCNPLDPECDLDPSTACTEHKFKRVGSRIRHVDQAHSTVYDIHFMVGCPLILDWSQANVPIYVQPRLSGTYDINFYDQTYSTWDRPWQDGNIRDFVTMDSSTKTTTLLVPDEARTYGFHDGFNPANGAANYWSKGYARMHFEGHASNVDLKPSCPSGQFADRTYTDQDCLHEYPIVTTVTICEHCDAGYAKNTVGNQECTPCQKGFYADVEESLTCQECSRFNDDTTVAEAATNETLCVCSSGFYLKDNSACIPCIDGAYKSDDGNHLCTLCGVDPIHSYSTHDDVGAVTQSVCTSCPVNSGQDQSAVTFGTPMDDVTDCLCFPGFTDDGGCVQCEDYKFKLGYSNDACAYCADGYFFVGHAQACVQCSLQDASNASRHHVGHAYNSLLSETSWGTDFSDCTCDLGFIRSTDECEGCAPGSFRAEHSVLSCSSCAFNTYQNQAAQTACLSCPTNSYTNVTGASSISQCYCDAGYEMNVNTYICEQCDAGKFKGPGPESCSACPAGTYSLEGASECTPCAATETSAEASPAESHCVCQAGFGGASCLPCQPGFYSAEGTLEQPDQECQSCPVHKTSAIQSTLESDCVCQPGFGVDPSSDTSAECTACIDGQYSAGGNEFCRLCGFATVTDPSTEATSIDACQCDAASGVF